MTSKKKKILMVVNSPLFSCEAWFTNTQAIRYSKRVKAYWQSIPAPYRIGELKIEFRHGG